MELPKKCYTNITPLDGVFALGYMALYGLAQYLITLLHPRGWNGTFAAFCVQLIWISGIFCIAHFRKQPFVTIGFGEDQKAYTFTVAATVLVATYAYFTTQNSAAVLGQWMWMFLGVAFTEELLFRSFAYPRIQILCRNKWISLLICGVVFGIVQGLPLVARGGDVWQSLVGSLGGAMIGEIIFVFLYTKTKNILFPILIHALLLFSSVYIFSK